MAAEMYLLIHEEINWFYIGFVFASTLALYNFPVLLENTFFPELSSRHQWVHANKRLLIILFVLAAVVTGVLVFFLPLTFILWFAPVAVLAFLYFFPQTQLRGITGLKTFIVAFVWTSTTSIFPLLLISDFDPDIFSEGDSQILFLQNFLFIFPLCLIFNVRDVSADRKANVRTLPVIYGVRITILACVMCLLAFSLLIIFSGFEIKTQIALLLSGILVTALILFASEKRPDHYYSLWVDGMILLQAFLVFLV